MTQICARCGMTEREMAEDRTITCEQYAAKMRRAVIMVPPSHAMSHYTSNHFPKWAK